MSDETRESVLAEIPEPGVFSGVCTLLGGLLGALHCWQSLSLRTS